MCSEDEEPCSRDLGKSDPKTKIPALIEYTNVYIYILYCKNNKQIRK